MEVPNRFKSRDNDFVKFSFHSPSMGIKVNEGYFISRAPAVAGLVFAITKKGTKVLIGKRSKTMRDSPGTLGIPCGYMNWDETLHEGMMREVYEETSFYMPDYEEQLVFNNDKHPFMMKDKPTEPHQNITAVFISVFNFEDDDDGFMDDINNFTCKESEWTNWLSVSDFFETHHKHSWAFNHDDTIKKGWDLWVSLPYND